MTPDDIALIAGSVLVSLITAAGAIAALRYAGVLTPKDVHNMPAADRILAARDRLTDALAKRRGRPHIDAEEAREIGAELVDAVKAAIKFGAVAAAAKADGKLTLKEAQELAPLAAAMGMEVGEVLKLVDEALED